MSFDLWVLFLVYTDAICSQARVSASALEELEMTARVSVAVLQERPDSAFSHLFMTRSTIWRKCDAFVQASYVKAFQYPGGTDPFVSRAFVAFFAGVMDAPRHVAHPYRIKVRAKSNSKLQDLHDSISQLLSMQIICFGMHPKTFCSMPSMQPSYRLGHDLRPPIDLMKRDGAYGIVLRARFQEMHSVQPLDWAGRASAVMTISISACNDFFLENDCSRSYRRQGVKEMLKSALLSLEARALLSLPDPFVTDPRAEEKQHWEQQQQPQRSRRGTKGITG